MPFPFVLHQPLLGNRSLGALASEDEGSPSNLNWRRFLSFDVLFGGFEGMLGGLISLFDENPFLDGAEDIPLRKRVDLKRKFDGL